MDQFDWSVSGWNWDGISIHIPPVWTNLIGPFHAHVCGRKKYLNRTLAIDSLFQTFAVGLLLEFID